MHKINLHAHTYLSDGRHGIIEMAKSAHAQGHTAFVLTDHDYSASSFLIGEYMLRLTHEYNLSPIPIIHGSEISTPWGECLLFGQDALYAYFSIRYSTHGRLYESTSIKPMFGIHLDKTNNKELWLYEFITRICHTAHALALCHPGQYCSPKPKIIDTTEKLFLSLLHGIEVENYCSQYPEVEWLIEGYLRPNIKRLHNSDAHSVGGFDICCNETEERITTDPELIRWLGGNIE